MFTQQKNCLLNLHPSPKKPDHVWQFFWKMRTPGAKGNGELGKDYSNSSLQASSRIAREVNSETPMRLHQTLPERVLFLPFLKPKFFRIVLHG